jgi:hypothetical protein
MPLEAWLAAAGVLALCATWRLSYYVYWRNTFGGRPVKLRSKPPNDASVVTLDEHGQIKPEAPRTGAASEDRADQ